MQGEYEKIVADGDYTSVNHANFSSLARGIYADQIKAWFDLFPAEQILLINSGIFFQSFGRLQTGLGISRSAG
ncbi:MAG: hypothetical protein ACREYE_33110 [Gammaproteobacteria bacterium]